MSWTCFLRRDSRKFKPKAVATRTTARMQKNKNINSVDMAVSSGDFDYGLEHRCRNLHAGDLQALIKLGANAGGAEAAGNAAVFGDPRLFEHKEVLHGDEFAFHADALGDGGNAAAAVAHTGDLNEQIDSGADLLADGAHAHIGIAHPNHDLQTADGIARGVGVHGGERAVVAGVHGLKHVERLFAADL